MSMRITRIIEIISVALLFILLSSCTKEEVLSGYGLSMWFGTYSIQVENNDTGALEDATAHIVLEFNHGALESAVTKSIDGLYSANRITYEVRWYSKDTFTLCKTDDGQTVQYYSGVINGNKMSFEFLSCDKVERTVELSKVINE